MSTDTAFALGVLALMAPHGTRLRVRLLTLAVVDDLVRAAGDRHRLHRSFARRAGDRPRPVRGAVRAPLAPPTWRRQVGGRCSASALWVALHESGIDPVIAGLAVGLVTSAYPPARADLERVTELARSFREQPTPSSPAPRSSGSSSAISPNERLQYRLHPWTSFVIVPLFALANAGIHIDGALLATRSPRRSRSGSSSAT